MKTKKLSLTGWSKRFLFMLVIAAICCPSLAWGQADQRVPIELKVKLNDGKIKIGHIFVEELKKQINRSTKFVLSPSEAARLVLRVEAQGIGDLPYQSVVSVIWTATAPGKGAPREIFLDYLVMVGVSAAHAGKDAEDILNYTQQKILSRFAVIKAR
jgi:hypothetical protein